MKEFRKETLPCSNKIYRAMQRAAEIYPPPLHRLKKPIIYHLAAIHHPLSSYETHLKLKKPKINNKITSD